MAFITMTVAERQSSGFLAIVAEAEGRLFHIQRDHDRRAQCQSERIATVLPTALARPDGRALRGRRFRCRRECA